MRSESPISTYSQSDLHAYYKLHVREPKSWWIKADKALDPVVAEIPPEYGRILKFAKNLLAEHKYKIARWQWLLPREDPYGLDDLPRLQRFCGLDHIGLEPFRSELRVVCLELREEHPKLSLWIDKRIALLDFKRGRVQDLPQDKVYLGIMFRQSQMLAQNLVHKGEFKDAAKMARQLANEAMHAAGQVAKLHLARDVSKQWQISANLMVPYDFTDLSREDFFPDDISKTNNEKASTLWRSIGNIRKCLVAVAETPDAGHLGFWVPLSSGAINMQLPGAPEAFHKLEGKAIFKEDLPPLTGFSAELTAAWINYMINEVNGHVILSTPFISPKSPSQSFEDVVAVFNMHISPHDESLKRAYHKEWLTVVSKQISQFIEVSYNATRFRILAENGGKVRGIENGSTVFDVLASSGHDRIKLEGQRKEK